MIKEFAVEPAAIVESALRFQYVTEKFGISEGRVISRFPSRWKKLVYEAAEQQHRGKVELGKIQVLLKKLPDSILISLARPGAMGEWLDIVKAEHQRQPFDWILTKNSEQIDNGVHLDAWDWNHPSLQNQRQVRIARTAEEMARTCQPLLSLSNHVKFIDPYFDLHCTRFREPFLLFLRCLPSKALVEIFIENRGDARPTNKYLMSGVRDFLSRINPDIEVKVWGHTGDHMHNRFILTPIGGVSFGCGLDVAEAGSTSMDEVTLIDKLVRAELWDCYSGGDPVGEWARN